MKKAFRDAYERELAILYERSAEFAEDYPGLAERLGGVLRDSIDPMVAGLLEGTAFLAARVQLKLDEEFSGFTTELLEQIFPDALAPIPSCMLVQGRRIDKSGEGRHHFRRGEYLDAVFRDANERVSCRFRLTAPLELVPYTLTALGYHDRTTTLAAMGQDPDPATHAGLVIDMAFSGKDESQVSRPDAIDFHLTGAMAEAVALYEQLHCDTTRLSLRYLAPNGDPVFMRLAPDQLQPVGFGADELLFDRENRLFEGFALLRDFFIFPRKFLGFRLTGLRDRLSAIGARDFQIIAEFSQPNADVARNLRRDDIRLNCVPAINLFEIGSNQIRLDEKRHEYLVTPDSGPMTHYEIQRLLSVHATYQGDRKRVRLFPLYGLPQGAQAQRSALYYTARRKPRRPTLMERKHGRRLEYFGTETYISIYEPPEAERDAHRLHVRALCSNRHLPAALPLADTEHFYMSEDAAMVLKCVAGPTPPREAMTEIERSGPHRMRQGDVYWRLISYLSLNHFGLDDRFGRDGAASLREILTLFADLSDNVSETQIAGIIGMKVRPVTRSIRRPEGFFPARGLEIAITYDETAFEGSGIILLAAALDRFFAEYTNINSFSQTVTISRQRGEIKRWPPRTGQGPLL